MALAAAPALADPYILSADNAAVIGAGMSGNWRDLDAGDARVAAYLSAQAAQAQAAQALAAGMPLVSTATPALDGTYAIDPATQVKVQAVALYIAVNGRFPAGQSALAWPDAQGAIHAFPTTASFQAFASAMGDFVTALALGQTPAQPVSIP